MESDKLVGRINNGLHRNPYKGENKHQTQTKVMDNYTIVKRIHNLALPAIPCYLDMLSANTIISIIDKLATYSIAQGHGKRSRCLVSGKHNEMEVA